MTQNQLLAEAQRLDDLDEFAGLSIVDIAQAIIHWPEGSEDQARAIAAIRARAPGMGHNRPPLAEALDEELAGLADRQARFLEIAGSAVILDQASAEKVTNLSGQIAALEREAEEARTKRVKPYLDAQRLINDRYHQVIRPLTLARQGESGRAGLRGILTAWEDKKEAAAEAERQRLREAARQREAEAEAARRAAEERARAGQGTVADELEVMRATDEAERLALRAEAIRAEPTRAHLGQVTRRREIRFDIVSLREVLGWMIKQDGLRNQITQAVNTIIGSYLKGLGVDAVERGIKIPGADNIRVERGPASVRR